MGLLRLYGLEVSARGPFVEGGRYPARDASGRGRLFVMNHRSMLDIFVNLAFLEASSSTLGPRRFQGSRQNRSLIWRSR